MMNLFSFINVLKGKAQAYLHETTSNTAKSLLMSLID